MEKLKREINIIEEELDELRKDFDYFPTLYKMRAISEKETTLKILKDALNLVEKSA